MLRNKSFLCFIPARGGSRGIKDKNIILLAGRPLISYCLASAKDSGIFDKIIVSTDSAKIKTVAELYGTEVIDRPAHLAEDDSRIEDVMTDALATLPKHDYIQLFEPTCPLLDSADILGAALQLINTRADMIISVCPSSAPLGISAPLGPNNSMKDFVPEELRRRNRQDIPNHYELNSAIYMGRWDVFAEDKDYYAIDTRAYTMGRNAVNHVDTPADLKTAEQLLKRRVVTQAIMRDFLENLNER